jgi:Ca2+-binding RTX toxin-like protein
MEIDGAGLVDGALTEAFWVQGAHGGLTTLHGGGNLYVNVEGKFNIDNASTPAGKTHVVRVDGRSFGVETGFKVGQIVQLEGEAFTREVLRIDSLTKDDAAGYGEDNPFQTWGFESVLVLSDPLAGGAVVYDDVDTADTQEKFLIHQAEALETIVTLEVQIQIEEVDGALETTVTRTDGLDWGSAFVQGGVLFIEGYAGGFQIKEVLGDRIVLLDAALGDCGGSDGIATLRFLTYDITRSGGQRVGGDHFIVTGGAGPDSPLVIYGDTSQDGVWYSGHSYDRLGLEFGEKPFDPFPHLPDQENEDDEWVFGLANPFKWHGNDIIDASALFADYDGDGEEDALAAQNVSVGITAYGGMGNDLLLGSQAGDHLAGGSGHDTIIGNRGTDHIYGDSGVNVNVFTRALYITTLDQSPLPSVDPDLPRGDSSIDPAASPVRDPMGNRPTDPLVLDGLLNVFGAGDDVIDGNGSGLEDGTPDIVFGDHGEVVQFVVDPNLPDPDELFGVPVSGVLLQKIQTTLLDSILEINSKEVQTGGDDIIFGSEVDDVLIGGAGNDMIDGLEGDDQIFGDNVYLSRMGGSDGNLLDDIASLRFQTLAGTLIYSRTDRPAEAGYGKETLPGVWEITPDTSGVLMVSLDVNGNPIARDYRDPNGPQWWTEYEIDYADLHTFDFNDGVSGAGSFGNDYIAGNEGNDQIFGQLGNDIIQGDGAIRAAVATKGDGTALGDDEDNPLFAGIIVPTRYVSAGRELPELEDPAGALKVVTATEGDASADGNDYVEGGGGCDVIFGGLGQDDLVGGSSSFFSLDNPDVRPDGDDMIFGGSGVQIDRLNESLPDDGTADGGRHSRDADTIAGDNANIIRLVGVNGIDLIADDAIDPNAPNAAAQYGALYLSRDGLHLSYDYDNFGTNERIIARGVTHLDYTPGGPDYRTDLFNLDPVATPNDGLDPATDDLWRKTFGFWSRIDIGGHDEVHGETGDDTVYLQGGNDIAFGDGDSDDVVGGWGNDWISGGTGIDGVLGDDGRIFTSRNTGLSSNQAQYGEEFAEALYGVFSLLNNDPDSRTSQGNVLDEEIYTPGHVQQARINIEGELLKSVDLTPFDSVEGASLLPVQSADPTHHDPLFADDVIFGGTGDDFIHGGSGDDAVAGGEALPDSYAPVITGDPVQGSPGHGNSPGTAATPIDYLVRTDFTRPYNPGNLLLFGDGDEHWNEPNPVLQRTGEFFLYDEYDPRRVILFGDDDQVWKGDAIEPTLRHYFLNQRDNEGTDNADAQLDGVIESFVDFAPNGTPLGAEVAVESDGNDVIFGDLGNDWIVGGTGRDHIYGGFGNDLMNADDVTGGPGNSYDTGEFGSADEPDAGLNDTPETHISWEDRVFGGAGLDILIGNTGGDRLIDHLGEFNSYIVPFAPFGISTVSRQVPPQLWDFLSAQAASDGIDMTRTTDTGQTNGDRSRYSNVFDQMGEPYGELGLVTQQDHGFWQDQSGPPTDPQAGNIPGGRRDILRTADFDNRTMDAFSKDVGNFTATGGQLAISSATPSSVAAAVYMLDDYLPNYYEVLATFNLDKPTGGWKSNGYVIFDYHSDIDFKFAGINVSTNKIEMGYRDAAGWHYLVQSNKPVQIKPNNDYAVTVAVNGNNVTLAVAGVNWFTYDFAPRYDALGDPIPLNRGMIGVGMDGSTGRVDNFTIQILPPDWTLEETDDFAPPAELTRLDVTGGWDETAGVLTGTASANGPAVQLVDLGEKLSANSILEMEVDIATGGTAGFVFDRYDADNYKFVALDVAADRVIIGHARSEDGVVVDASFARALDATSTYRLKATMQGAGIQVSVNGTPVTSYGFNAALVDGSFGLMALDGTATFDELDVRTDDAKFEEPAAQELIASAASAPDVTAPETLTWNELTPVVGAAIAGWRDSGLVSSAAIAGLADVSVVITDLADQQLGRLVDGVIYVDVDAAGHGWFVDTTPYDSSEFALRTDDDVRTATAGSVAFGAMDLLTAVRHEIGHALGFGHDDGLAVMRDELDTGVRYELEAGTAAPQRGAQAAPAMPAFYAFAGSGGADAGIDWQSGSSEGWSLQLSPYDTGKSSKKTTSNLASFEVKLLGNANEFDSLGRELLGKKQDR